MALIVSEVRRGNMRAMGATEWLVRGWVRNGNCLEQRKEMVKYGKVAKEMMVDQPEEMCEKREGVDY